MAEWSLFGDDCFNGCPKPRSGEDVVLLIVVLSFRTHDLQPLVFLLEL